MFENHLLAHSVKLVLERTNYEVGSMGVGACFYMYDVVVKKFTFAVSSADEFLLLLAQRR